MDIDDDEFGDLYTDVLRPVSAAAAAPPAKAATSNAPLDPVAADDDEDDQILYGSSRTTASFTAASKTTQIPAPAPADDGDDDWLLGPAPVTVEPTGNWIDDEDDIAPSGAPARTLGKEREGESRVLKEVVDPGARVSGTPGGGVLGDKDRGFAVADGHDGSLLAGGGGGRVGMEIDDLNEEPVIPGLTAVSAASGGFHGMNGGNSKTSRSDDWDSDSEDDLQIVLNDNSHGPLGGDMSKALGDEDDEDGEEDLVIVADEVPHNLPAMEEQEWGDEGMQVAADGERKEMGEMAKGNGAVGGVAGARIGFSSHGFHAQHHSMYKYVRPGAAPVAGGPMSGTAGAPGQARPPLGMGTIAGRGRGDWRPIGGRGVPTQKSFHPGYGPAWGNNSSARPFGIGLDFTLPSHKTVFDVDIDGFEEKPWRYPGVDISDFFNFGLDEDNWKEYCKQLEQLRLESTMQSKIRVYESGRSEQDYDPDLPPELAAATGLHDSAENAHHAKVDNGQADMNGQGRAMACIRPPLPTGRAIQVEGGYGERLPSIDTRPPRVRDADAIIEIVLQDPVDDSTTYNGALDQAEYDDQEEHLKGVHKVHEEDTHTHNEREFSDRTPQAFGDRNREMPSRRVSSAHEEDGILPFPSEAPKSRSPAYSGVPSGTHPGGRLPHGGEGGKCSSGTDGHSRDLIHGESVPISKNEGSREGKMEFDTDGNQNSEQALGDEIGRELSMEQRDDEHDERLALGDDIVVEGEDMTSDSRISHGTNDDERFVHSTKKQKLSSRVEQPALRDGGDGDDLRNTQSGNIRVKSGSIKEHQRRREGGEEEVMQDGRSRGTAELRRRREEEHNLRRKDDYGRDEREKSRLGSRGRTDVYHSYQHRDLDSNSVHLVRGRNEAFERSKERDGSLGIWQKKEDEVYRRRVKDEDLRREHGGETGSRHRSRGQMSDGKDKDEDPPMKKRVDEGEWRGRDRELAPRQREREDILVSRRENLDDHHIKRRKDEDHTRRERSDKEDPLHTYMVREETSRRKRERDETADHRRREDAIRVRDKLEDHHSTRPQDDSWQHREREDRYRLRQPTEEAPRHREREEGKGAARNGRSSEDKPPGGNRRNKDESKGLGSDKDYHNKDKRRQSDQSRKEQHKGRDVVNARENQFSNEDRSLRQEKRSSNKERPSSTTDSQQIYRERNRDNTRRSNDIETSGRNFQGAGKRKNDDHSFALRDDKVRIKSKNEQENKNSSFAMQSKDNHQILEKQPDDSQRHLSSSKHGDDNQASEDDNLDESRRGRSKLERWTSHQEREYGIVDNIQSVPSFLRSKEVERSNTDAVQPDGVGRTEGSNAGESDPKDSDLGQIPDKSGEDKDRNLDDTVAKLKRRSERFKLPMPGEKETSASKRLENEVRSNPSEAAADAEFKPERPARKRRWTSS